MTLLKPSEPWFVTPEQGGQRLGHAARAELALRQELELFCRQRWPDARVVHELVMGERRVRADVVAIDIAHIAAFEVKGHYDDTVRLLHQVGMYQLCVPEVWMLVDRQHSDDARLIRHLLPSVGLIIGAGLHSDVGRKVEFEEILEPAPREIVPRVALEMLWRDELVSACRRSRCFVPSPKSTRPAMIKALLTLPLDEIQKLICAELRARNALWRADAAIGASA